MSATDLLVAYERLRGHESLRGSHVSIDRDHQGGESLNVAPDWIESAGITAVLGVARELELEVVLTKAGLRLAEYDDAHSVAVRDVKRVLNGDDE